jgi:hypothetical protein
MLRPTITRQEWRNVVLFALAVMFLTTLPYLVGAAAQRSDVRFGWFLFGIVDGNSYLAKMREGAVDGWLFHIAFTSEPHSGAVLFTPYLAGGKLAALFAPPSSPTFVDAMLVIFQFSRIIFGALLIVVMYRFIATFVIKRSLRWLALVLACLGGGLGWLLIAIGQGNWLGSPPIDFFVPEGFTFFLLYGLPHLALARAGLLFGLLLTIHTLVLPSPRRWIPLSVLAGLCWLVMGLCVPFYIAVLYAILGSWGLATWIRQRAFPWRLFFRCFVGALIPFPYLAYNFYVFGTNPVLGAWSAQNILPSPNPLHYVIGYGILAILALPAIRWGWHRARHSTAYLLPVSWVIAAPVLVYLPINVQKRLLEGVFVPLCVLAVIGLRLWWIGSGVRRKPRRARQVWQQAVVVLLLLLLPSTLLLLGGGIALAAKPDPASPVFYSTAEIAALDWLNTHALPDSVVLCRFDDRSGAGQQLGNYLPVRTSLRAYIGHGPETLNLDEKRRQVDRFLAGEMSADEARSLLAGEAGKTDPIRYVIAQDSDKVQEYADLHQIYERDGYTIYEVRAN